MTKPIRLDIISAIGFMAVMSAILTGFDAMNGMRGWPLARQAIAGAISAFIFDQGFTLWRRAKRRTSNDKGGD
ncbi:hypothetical protein [Nitrospirillum iridis]|uniref:Divalent metal cation (Fe/Co/Zn/Cd) transporter n=1 Tax=Nitrospirillum iridis TaxID=765888 RepID=A0A7X0B4Q5_9PROT|nr:hypothetical protein [Nitrospirillum iridis]MBB6254620.1 divalent metal cation (Fe/Co/Zn/Cd) transporter [Nitrospirillum iridis]